MKPVMSYTSDLLLHVDKGQEPFRIDKFLMNRIESATRNKLQQAINAGLILVNNKEVKQNYKVKPMIKLSSIPIFLLNPPKLFLKKWT